MRKKWIPVGLTLGLMAVAVAVGYVLASGGDSGKGTGIDVAEDGDVLTESIENPDVAPRQPDELAVRIAEILGTDPRATSDAMARVDSAESANPVGAGADGRSGERDVASMSVEAEWLSYAEYGARLGEILAVDGDRAGRAIAQAYQELYGVERDLDDRGSGADIPGRRELGSGKAPHS